MSNDALELLEIVNNTVADDDVADDVAARVRYYEPKIEAACRIANADHRMKRIEQLVHEARLETNEVKKVLNVLLSETITKHTYKRFGVWDFYKQLR